MTCPPLSADFRSFRSFCTHRRKPEDFLETHTGQSKQVLDLPPMPPPAAASRVVTELCATIRSCLGTWIRLFGWSYWSWGLQVNHHGLLGPLIIGWHHSGFWFYVPHDVMPVLSNSYTRAVASTPRSPKSLASNQKIEELQVLRWYETENNKVQKKVPNCQTKSAF